MALAKTTTETATEKIAAAKRFEANTDMVFSFVRLPVRPSLRAAQYIASAVPVLRNGRIPAFFVYSLNEQMFMIAKIWENIPTFSFACFECLAWNLSAPRVRG